MPPIPLESIQALPVYHRATVDDSHLDIMGHMNIRWYFTFYDTAGWAVFASLGMTQTYFQHNNAGVFALSQHIRYLAEVRLGETVAIHARVLGRSARRMHFIMVMVNQTTGVLASTLEGLASHADLTVRRTSPFPPDIAANIDALLAQHTALDWPAPTCGLLSP